MELFIQDIGLIKKTILQDGSEIINSAENKSVVKWNMEVEEASTD